MDDKRLDRLENKIDKMDEKIDTKLGKIDVQLAIYNEQLKIHIKGTEQNRQDISPLKRKVGYAEGAIKFLVFLGVIAAIYEAMEAASRYFR